MKQQSFENEELDNKKLNSRIEEAVLVEAKNEWPSHGVHRSQNINKQGIISYTVRTNVTFHMGKNQFARIELRGVSGKKKHTYVSCKQQRIEIICNVG